jgi:hypothetical protein
MRKAGQIILLVSGILYILLGFVFFVIESRLFFSFDWQVYAHPALGGLSAFFRMLVALLYIASGILAIFLFGKKPHPVLTIYVDVFALATFVIGGLIASFIKKMAGETPLYLTLPISLSSDLYFVGAVLLFIVGPSAQKPVPEASKGSK